MYIQWNPSLESIWVQVCWTGGRKKKSNWSASCDRQRVWPVAFYVLSSLHKPFWGAFYLRKSNPQQTFQPVYQFKMVVEWGEKGRKIENIKTKRDKMPLRKPNEWQALRGRVTARYECVCVLTVARCVAFEAWSAGNNCAVIGNWLPGG